MGDANYPWYEVILEGSLEQGDIILNCPMITISASITDKPLDLSILEDGYDGCMDAEISLMDAIVLSQSCDLANDKISHVTLCRIVDTNRIKDHGITASNIGELIKGRNVHKFLINNFESREHNQLNLGYTVVDFQGFFSIPKKLLEACVKNNGARLRLLPPYREHLSQSFARTFMRVGLPINIDSNLVKASIIK